MSFELVAWVAIELLLVEVDVSFVVNVELILIRIGFEMNQFCLLNPLNFLVILIFILILSFNVFRLEYWLLNEFLLKIFDLLGWTPFLFQAKFGCFSA